MLTKFTCLKTKYGIVDYSLLLNLRLFLTEKLFERELLVFLGVK